MPRAVNPYGKTVKRENAHFVYQSSDGSWTWYCLRTYQTPEKEALNPYARWYCNVVSPLTSERGETGDVYVAEIKAYARKLDDNPLVPTCQDDSTGGHDEVHQA